MTAKIASMQVIKSRLTSVRKRLRKLLDRRNPNIPTPAEKESLLQSNASKEIKKVSQIRLMKSKIKAERSKRKRERAEKRKKKEKAREVKSPAYVIENIHVTGAADHSSADAKESLVNQDKAALEGESMKNTPVLLTRVPEKSNILVNIEMNSRNEPETLVIIDSPLLDMGKVGEFTQNDLAPAQDSEYILPHDLTQI